MEGIGGNKTINLQIKTTTKNQIGESVESWLTVLSLNGWLDYLSGDARYSSYSAKIQESTHVFVSDYALLNADIEAEKTRAIIEGKIYNVTFIDNPMELNYQLEIYLKFTGGQ